MFVHDKSYPTDLHFVQSVRSCLLRHYTLDTIILIESYLNKNIECIDISYNSFNYSFTLRIRKGSMKKNFKHEASFYYDRIMSSLLEFFMDNRELIVKILRDEFGMDADFIYDNLLERPIQLYNLFNVYCLSNYIMQINL